MADDASGRRAWTFTDLIRSIHDVPGIERIRFATSHPRYFTGQSHSSLYGSLQSLCLTARSPSFHPLHSPLYTVRSAAFPFLNVFLPHEPLFHPPLSTLPSADRLVRACAELPKMCEYFHIPFQVKVWMCVTMCRGGEGHMAEGGGSNKAYRVAQTPAPRIKCTVLPRCPVLLPALILHCPPP